MNLSPWEIGILLVIVLLLFGAKRLPELARSAGESIREFKKSLAAPEKDAPDQQDDSAAK